MFTAEKVFKEFGSLLKCSRERDDYLVMCSYMPNACDMPVIDDELNRKLDENYKYFKKKEEEVSTYCL